MSGKQGAQIDLSQLPISQLNSLNQQFQEEIDLFTNSLNQLKLAQTKYVESQESLNKVTPANKDKEIDLFTNSLNQLKLAQTKYVESQESLNKVTPANKDKEILEIDLFTNSLNQLKLAQTKYVESQESLNKVTPANKDKEILVPLTSSMYVSGQLSDTENVLVDIGTGYYVDMTVEKGKEYFKRRVEFLSKQIEKIQPLLQEKYKMKQVTTEILQLKVQAQLQVQQQAAKT